MMTVARWTADKVLYYFNKRSIVIKLPVKRALWFSVYNWQVASCEYKQYILRRCFAERIYREKGSQPDESVKKCNQDKVNYANSKRRVFKVGIM